MLNVTGYGIAELTIDILNNGGRQSFVQESFSHLY